MKNRQSVPHDQNGMMEYLDASADQLDEHRLAGLQEEKNHQLIKDEVLQRERKRMEEKHGKSHPVVRETESRLEYNKHMFAGLDKEIERASIKTTPLPRNAWRVHGRVFEDGKNPVRDVTVFLADQNNRWIEAFGNSCTNGLGYYSLTIDENQMEKVELKQPMFLSVSDKSQKPIYRSKDPIFLSKGIIAYRDLFLVDDDCAPPKDDNVGDDRSAKSNKNKK